MELLQWTGNLIPTLLNSRDRPIEGKKGYVIFSMEGIPFGRYHYAHPIWSMMPEYFQYQFCKQYCVLPLLQNTMVSPTCRCIHTIYLLKASQGLCCEQLPDVPIITFAIRWCKAQPTVLYNSDTQKHTNPQEDIFILFLHASLLQRILVPG